MKTKGLTIGHCVSHLGSAPTEPKTDVLVLILCDAATRQGPDAGLDAVTGSLYLHTCC